MTQNAFHIGSLTVPALALGTMYFGTHVPTDLSMACLDKAFEVGARFWDTANNYAFWAGGVGDESEIVIGDWLHAHGAASRDQVTLATKVGARPRVPGSDLDDTLGLSSVAVRGQVEDCLRRLRTDRIDLLYAHIDDLTVPFEETLGAFTDLVEQGLVREVAASNLTIRRLDEAMAIPTAARYRALQQRFTWLTPQPGADLSPHVLLDDEIIDLCDRHGLTRLGYSPLLSGAYTRSDRPLPAGYQAHAEALAALHDVADRHGLDAGQAVLTWMVSRNQSVIPVVGVSSPDQVRSAWQAVTTPLPTQDVAVLEDARRV